MSGVKLCISFLENTDNGSRVTIINATDGLPLGDVLDSGDTLDHQRRREFDHKATYCPL